MIRLEDLDDYRYLEVLIRRYDQELRRLDQSPALPGMSPRVKKQYAAAVDELRSTLREKRSRSLKKQKELFEYIDSIEDRLIQEMFILRYIRGKTWTEIAFDIYDTWGLEYANDTPKKMCHRYIERQKKKQRKWSERDEETKNRKTGKI